MSEEEETHVVPYVDVYFAELVVQAINSYEESKNNEFSRALNKLVEISKKHCSLLLDASVVKTEKISQSDYVMELLKTAIPNHEKLIFNIVVCIGYKICRYAHYLNSVCNTVVHS